MIVESKFLYTRVLEGNGRVTKEPTFAGAVLMLIGIVIGALILTIAVGSVLSSFGIQF